MDNDQKSRYYKSILVIYNTITKNKSIFSEEILVTLNAVKRKLNFIGYSNEYDLLIIKTCPMFLKFRSQIEADDVEYLLNYDYTKLIEEDAEDENKKLIIDLIMVTKEAWVKLDSKNQTIIKERIKLCLNLGLLYQLSLV